MDCKYLTEVNTQLLLDIMIIYYIIVMWKGQGKYKTLQKADKALFCERCTFLCLSVEFYQVSYAYGTESQETLLYLTCSHLYWKSISSPWTNYL